jgi:preprotein translocase subunit SecD
LTFALFKLIPVTLTLAGIAGFILSIGMAVDANVLIFARLKEELRTGRTLSGAVEAGFDHAWTSIRDSNISTMITCLILYWFGRYTGASIIQGFALSLGIGVAVSMFTAITVTRTLLRLLLDGGLTKHRWWFGVERQAAPALGSAD